jgi:hypothetical protein
MDARDRSIGTQVAFKAAVDLAVKDELDLSSDEGQARFEKLFSHLTESLLVAMGATAEDQMAEVIRGQFPGTTTVTSNPSPTPSYQPGYTQPAPPAFNLAVKGNQFGPLPDWLYEQAASKGVVEVYDNRDRATGTKRPWFRSTSGGDDAPAFWPPR